MVTKTKKVFIGGLSATSTLEDMKSYFEQYGKVRFKPKLILKIYYFLNYQIIQI